MTLTIPTLTTRNHDRDIAGMTYVYPVVSRRAGGVSVGVNLNPNNACNWRCIYCQVPGLKRGGPPPIDLGLLEDELRRMLADIVDGDFMLRNVPEGMRRLNDVAISGNGEPTSAREFPEVVDMIGRLVAEAGLAGSIRLVLITNGSLAHRSHVQAGLRKMARLNGQVWFKFDRATRAGLRRVNDTASDPERHFQRLKIVAALCPTWVQTCLFSLDGAAPDEAEIDAYLAMLTRARAEMPALEGVLLYGLARPSLQPESSRLGQLPELWMAGLAGRIEALGLRARVSP
jgi:wyosine [tRNA(Phe)-imidazoG37] synthetase (radical SAM superfamily)